MQRAIKRVLVLILSLLLIAAVLVGCSSNKGTSPSSDAGQKGSPSADKDASSVPEELKLPIVDKKLTLTYWQTIWGGDVGNKSSNDTLVYKTKEDRTNIHIEFQHPPIGQESENFNLMLSSREFPDMIEYNWLSVPGGPQKQIDDGVIIKLNDLINKYAPNLKKVLDETPEARKQIVTDQGDMYIFPFLRIDPKLRIFRGLQIRQDWLDKLGLKRPTTMDEWYTVLKAFKEKDPNGNGKADELPTGAQGVGQLGEWLYAWNINNDFYMVDNKVYYGPIEPEYKEWLSTMRKWYAEGLIDPDFVSTDGKSFDSKVTGNQIGSFWGNMGGHMRKYTTLVKDPQFKLVACEYPVAKPGMNREIGQGDNLFPGPGTVLTTNNKHQVESVKWMDYNYSEEGHMLFNFGKEGVTYNMVNGYPKYSDEIMNNPEGLAFNQAMGKNGIQAAGSGPLVQDVRYLEQYMNLPNTTEAINIWSNFERKRNMPPITFTSDESTQIASIMNEINTYKNEMLAKFIMGTEPMENYDKFVQTLKSLGIENAIKIEQAALDRFNARK